MRFQVLTYGLSKKKIKVLTYGSFLKKKFWPMILSPKKKGFDLWFFLQKKKVLTYGSFSKKKSFDFMEDGGYLFIFYDNSDKNKWADVPMSQ